MNTSGHKCELKEYKNKPHGFLISAVQTMAHFTIHSLWLIIF